MTLEHVDFELARTLVQNGFDWEDEYYYVLKDVLYYLQNSSQNYTLERGEMIDEDTRQTANLDLAPNHVRCIPAPTLDLACKWLRSKDIIILPDQVYPCNIKTSPHFNTMLYTCTIDWFPGTDKVSSWQSKNILNERNTRYFSSYEKAQIAGITWALNNLLK